MLLVWLSDVLFGLLSLVYVVFPACNISFHLQANGNVVSDFTLKQRNLNQ